MTETARRQEAAAQLPVHRYSSRVYYEDTDAGGIVYHANYLRFAERARTEMMRAAGVPHAEMVARDGVMFAVSRCEVDYLRPARLDDLLDIETRLVEVGRATVDLEQIVRREGVDLARIRIRLACVDANGRPTRVPAAVRAAMAGAPPAVRPLS